MNEDTLFKASELRKQILDLQSFRNSLNNCDFARVGLGFRSGPCETSYREVDLDEDTVHAFIAAADDLIEEKRKEFEAL